MAIKKTSNSVVLGAAVIHAAFRYLVSRGGTSSLSDIKSAVAPTVAANDWAREVIESNGLTRWETYLHFFSIDAVKAGFLVKLGGVWTLTPSGIKAAELDAAELFTQANAAYRAWRKSRLGKPEVVSVPQTTDDYELDAPPEDRMQTLQRSADDDLAAELIERILENTPRFFEKLVLELLQKMGYGGFRPDAAQHTGKSGDGGIDGIIYEDALGLDPIFLQAKRYKGSVPDNEVRDFIGALAIQGGRKGVFITTGRFAENAKSHARTSQQPRIVLVDGPALALLMIKHEVGVSPYRQFTLKRVDSDWFDED